MSKIVIMKKIMSLLLLCAAFGGCTPEADYATRRQDLRFDNPADWQFCSLSQFYVTSEVPDARVAFQLNQCNGRQITVSAESVAGVCILPTVITLPDGAQSSRIEAALSGVTGDEPGKYTLVVNIAYDGTRILQWPIEFELLPKPDFGVQMDPSFSGKVLIQTDKFRNDYKYNVLGTAYDSEKEMLYLKLPYQFGGGRHVELDSYRIEDGNGLDAGDRFRLELETETLADNGTEIDYVMIRVIGKMSGHQVIQISQLDLVVTDPADPNYEFRLDADNGVEFAPGRLKFRTFDIMHAHTMNVTGTEWLEIGYDTVHVASKSDPAKVRALLVQPLGRIDNPEEYPNPFLYQWGRPEDGHQRAFSNTNISSNSSTLSDNPATSDWITCSTAPAVWQENPSSDDKLWDNSLTGGKNNPCPPGYRIPSINEAMPFDAQYEAYGGSGHEYLRDWLSGFTGLRNGSNGKLNVNANVLLWTCSPNTYGITNINTRQAMALKGDAAGKAYAALNHPRGNGFPVRCISVSEIDIK